MRLLSTLICLSLFAPTVFAETLNLKVKSTWLSDAPGEKIEGSAKGKAALTMTGKDFGTLKGDIVIDVKSMRTGNDTRDKHLMSPVWLDEAKHPSITFSIEAVAVKDGQAEVSGKISIHGVTKPLKATAKILTKGDKVKIKTSFQVSLADFNIEGKKGVVGDKVGKTIAVNATLKGKIK